MKKFLMFLLAALISISLVGAGVAQEKKEENAKPAEKKAASAKKVVKKLRLTRVEVSAVDAAGNSLTVKKKEKGKEEDVSLTVTPDTKITMGKEKKALADIKAGDKVSAQYVVEDGKNIAKSISVLVPTKKKAAKEEKPAAGGEKK